MANKKSLDLIQKYNEWLKNQTGEKPNLRGVDLSGVDLSGAEFVFS